MNNIFGMNIVKTTNELVCEHQHCFERELATAKVEEIFQTWAQKIKYHGVEFAFSLKGVNSWDTGTTREGSVDVGFGFEEGGIDRDVFEFDSDFIASVDVGSLYAVSLKKPLQSLRMWITYVHRAESSPTDPPLKLIFTGYA